MFNKNVFTQKDPIADIIKGINEADYKAKMEELKGNQHKIDKNKNNKIDAHDFKILRGEKKTMKEEEEVEESNNPFDVKNYKSQLKTKPGEKAGFDSKKVSTGTIYSRKPVKDEPMKKEEIEKLDELSVNKMLKYSDAAEKDRKKLNAKWDAGTASRKEQEKAIGREEGENRATNKIKKKTGKYPWQLNREETEQAGREVPNCVPKNEEIDPNDTSTDTLKGREKASANPFLSKKVKMDVPDNVKEDVEQVDEASTETKQEFLARQQRLAAAHSETQKDPKRLARLMKIPGYADAMKLAQKTTQKEEVEQMDERTLTKGETAEKERIVKGMKKSLAGFKARYGDKAKSVMYATATARAKKD
jgi:hypothetical protein